jgi:uncharacterized protein YfeS
MADDASASTFFRDLSPETAHPRAGEVLTEPSCWGREDHTSPFGAGQAFAMFVRFFDWRRRYPKGKAISCLKAVLRETGADDKHWDVVEPEEVDRLITDDEYGIGIRDDSVIGLAFAQLVAEGRVDEDVRGLAMLALRRQAQEPALRRLWSWSWENKPGERPRALDGMTEALARLGPPPDPKAASTPKQITAPKPEPVRVPAVVAIEGSGVGFPAEGGRVLTLGRGEILGEVRLRFDPRDESNDLPTDIVAAEFRTADSEGRVWSLTAHSTAEVFLTHMVDLSSISWVGPFPKKGRAAFQKDLLLEDIRFSSDDRFYRIFPVGKKTFDVQFKYTTLVFDVAIDRGDDPEDPHLTRLLVRLNEGSLLDINAKVLGDLVFSMDWRHLFRHNTLARDSGRLRESPFPLPLTFRPTDERAAPQTSVRLSKTETG